MARHKLWVRGKNNYLTEPFKVTIRRPIDPSAADFFVSIFYSFEGGIVNTISISMMKKKTL